LNWGHFLNLYNPAINLHALSGPLPKAEIPIPRHHHSTSSLASTTGDINGADNISALTLNDNTSTNDLRNAEATAKHDKAAAEIKRLWRAALKKCIAVDTERTGFVDRVTFLESLRDIVGKIITTEDVVNLTEKFSHEGGDVDYHMCFRNCMNESLAKNSSSSSSKFELAPISKSRPLRSVHPWQFAYTKGEDMPYWTRACVDPRPGTVASFEMSNTGFGKTSSANLLKEYDAKVISIARKVANMSNFREFSTECRRAQINNHKGFVTSDNFLAIASMVDLKLSKNELGTVMRVFRGRGICDVVNFKDFIELCIASKNVGEM
jgi:hypothetical protein